MTTEVVADALGEEWKGGVIPISGENHKQGSPMKQGILTHGCDCLLLSKGHSCYRPRTEEKKCKSVWGCIVDARLSVLKLVIVKKGRKIFLVSLIPLCPIAWGPEELAESTNVSLALKKICPPVCCEVAPKQR